jgi:hypothetical protein
MPLPYLHFKFCLQHLQTQDISTQRGQAPLRSLPSQNLTGNLTLDDLSYLATIDHEAEQKDSHAATPPRYCDMS